MPRKKFDIRQVSKSGAGVPATFAVTLDQIAVGFLLKPRNTQTRTTPWHAYVLEGVGFRFVGEYPEDAGGKHAAYNRIHFEKSR